MQKKIKKKIDFRIWSTLSPTDLKFTKLSILNFQSYKIIHINVKIYIVFNFPQTFAKLSLINFIIYNTVQMDNKMW